MGSHEDVHSCTTFLIDMFPFLLGKYPGVELLGHRRAVSLMLKEIAKRFSKLAASFHIPTGSVWVPVVPYP